ncbi:MAG: hypothetical protein JO149_05935 [Gammaproteobacteria bacterium]|nr:hypothetical protein [Gammaproteobacteria bacterium]
MKQFILFVSTVLFSAYSFADKPVTNLSSSLGAAWKAQSSLHAKLNSHDLTIVYGGADISSQARYTTFV